MSNDFINRRFDDNRRRRSGPSPQTVQGEVIRIADFDTFIWHIPANLGSDRWSALPNAAPPSTSASSSSQIPVGLLNPWNNSTATGFPPDSGQLAAAIAPRTPTRAIFGFNLSGIPQTATITEANLYLTVAQVNSWDTVIPGTE